MTNFLNKLNVLVRASVNSILSDVSGQEAPRSGQIPAERLGKNIDQEIAALRKRIDEALTDEEAMQNRLDGFQQQIDSLDQQADAAVAQGDESEARRLIQQMQRQQQSAAMLQADLEQHRQSTSDFIERVNTLEAMVSDARRARESGQPDPVDQSASDTSAEHTPGIVLSNLLREARERVEQAITPSAPATPMPPTADAPVQHIPVNIEGTTAEPPAPSPPTADVPVQHIPVNIQGDTVEKPGSKKDTDVDDDLAKRRARLSKPE